MVLREGFSSRNPERWGAVQGGKGRATCLRLDRPAWGGARGSVAQTCLSLKAQDTETGLIPSPQGHPAGRSVGARPVQGRQVGSANWIFLFLYQDTVFKIFTKDKLHGFPLVF